MPVSRRTLWIGAALAWRPMRDLGRISYGVYVYHPLVIYGLIVAGLRGMECFLLASPPRMQAFL